MQLQIVPARTGWHWIGQGVKTFFRQPLGLAGLFFLFMMLASLVSVLPVIGLPIVLTLMPSCTLGLMAATREVDAGRFPMPVTLFTALRGPREQVRRMLLLGGAYAVAVAAILLVVSLLGGDIAGPLATGDDIQPEDLQAALMQRGSALLLTLVLYTPVSMAFWHAPALVHWNGVSPPKAVFFSLTACWANRWAMLVYVGGWALVLAVVGNLLIGVVAMLGGAQVLQVLLLPLSLLMAAIFHTSIYFTYRDSFSAD
ncbi:MAG: BPSS1780 family membrane protein [Hydrogenophaga sp.]|jgi:hypothetical protein|uniref:BPSS1780 family membrane protein n=1 Tax=Hydrogenophaga sp. TaxID=1904254 RepID=UPI002A36B563|nr:BPSS1780 family membrane protein [Hydrogenophaga sp.]MDX9968209.1 BPSS1780 family membrane protein [Hydrogenophaga sp.]